MRQKADDLIARNVEAVKASTAHAVVFTCPACRLMWVEEYRERLPGVRMLHATELLVDLIAAGQFKPGKFESTVTYHDPCDLARTGGVYEAPRQVLASIPGIKLLEVDERRGSGLCCGGGGDVEMVSPQTVRQVGHRTAKKLSAPGAETLATACPQCMRVLEEAMKQVKPDMKVLDITEILARSAEL
jgi:heterodisulfide reductase subunit D